jgi:hypothetical protein
MDHRHWDYENNKFSIFSGELFENRGFRATLVNMKTNKHRMMGAVAPRNPLSAQGGWSRFCPAIDLCIRRGFPGPRMQGLAARSCCHGHAFRVRLPGHAKSLPAHATWIAAESPVFLPSTGRQKNAPKFFFRKIPHSSLFFSP